MAHALETLIRSAEPFLLIGDSREGRFPAQSFHCYTRAGKRFHCLDLGGMRQSRGGSKGRPVFTSVEELPEDCGELAIIWVKPRSAASAVEVAHQAGSKRIWFSFQCGHRDAVAKAKELGLEVVEIGRCPVYYLEKEKQVPACRAHTAIVKLSGSYGRPPQLDPNAKRRELW